jgi:putative ABC transport system permease protein
MRALDRKLWRDLVHLRGQLGAVALVVACGIALFVAFRSAYGYLRSTEAAYYRDYRFADAFAHVVRAPSWIAREIAAMPEVTAVETRVVEDVVLDVPGMAEPAMGRLISVPVGRRPRLDDLYLRRGRWVAAGRRDEVLASEAFARANGLDVGSSVVAVLNGRRQRLLIVGIALSPEYVYEIGSAADIFPDNRRFGVLWMDEDALAAAFQLRGAWNDVALALVPGAVTGDVLGRLDRLLAPYGAAGAYTRDDQLSHRFVSDEIAQNRVTSVLVPGIVLGIAAFLLHIVMARLVSTQRDQVAVLKAFGYGNLRIATHYVELALAAFAVGAIPGTGLGLWLATLMAGMYARFYQFPMLSYESNRDVIAAALLIAGGAAVVGVVGAVRRVAALAPAEAMRPEAPARFRPGLIERLGLGWLAPPAVRSVLRNLERRPVRSLLSVTVVALAAALVIASLFVYDAIAVIRDLQFGEIDREDVTLVFASPRSAAVRSELARLPGVLRAEPFRSVGVRLRRGPRSHRSALLGLEPEGVLHRIVGKDRQPWRLSAGGILLSEELARALAVAPGDSVTVEVLEEARPVREVPVAGTVSELVGMSAYIDLPSLHRLLREGDTLSGAYLAVDSRRTAELYAELKRLPAVAGVAVHAAVLAAFDQTIAESFLISIGFLMGFSCVIAFGVIYNGARISLSERGRELASLRVLGFSRGEVAGMLLGEQALVTIAALPLGCAIGYLSAALLAGAASSELYRIPLAVSRTTYVLACGVVMAAAALSGLVVRRRLDRLDLVEVLKTRE